MLRNFETGVTLRSYNCSYILSVCDSWFTHYPACLNKFTWSLLTFCLNIVANSPPIYQTSKLLTTLNLCVIKYWEQNLQISCTYQFCRVLGTTYITSQDERNIGVFCFFLIHKSVLCVLLKNKLLKSCGKQISLPLPHSYEQQYQTKCEWTLLSQNKVKLRRNIGVSRGCVDQDSKVAINLILPYFKMHIIWICFVNLISSIRGFSPVLIIVIKLLVCHLAPLLCLLVRTVISMKTDRVRYEEVCHCHFLVKISIKTFRTSS